MTAVVHPAAATSGVARVTVDLEAIAANTGLLATRSTGALMAVVKADAFGHGAVPVARTALSSGATWLGVTSIAEAMELRAAGLVSPLLSWLNPVVGDFSTAVAHRVDVAVPSRDHLGAVAHGATTAGARARVHLHIDVGMARDGASPTEWERLCRDARALERRGLVEVVGLMGHLGGADRPGDHSSAIGQRRFEHGADVARSSGLDPHVRHLAATAALLHEPGTHLDLCRVGAGLFGIDPSGGAGLRPAMTLTAPVVTVRDVAEGTAVGYGGTWVAPSPTRLALLSVGYADGLPRTCSGTAEVMLGGRRCPVVGTISMDQVVVDVGDAPVRPGDTATVFGAGTGTGTGTGTGIGTGTDGEPTVAEWASWAGTIEHEILTGIGRRVERVVTPMLRPRLRGVR